MKEIAHENMNRFYGLCVVNYEATIVSAHCSRGSLRVHAYMTANLLTLNSSKTEFLPIGLPQQFAKINIISLITTLPARNIGFIFDIVKKLSSLKRLLRTTSATRRSKTANITKR